MLDDDSYNTDLIEEYFSNSKKRIKIGKGDKSTGALPGNFSRINTDGADSDMSIQENMTY